jgi:thioredoxin reductase (NADPH)
LEFWQVMPYVSAAVATVGLYLRRHRRIESICRTTLAESIEAGLTDPPSLHPVVNPVLCIGAGSCVKVCPEGALGIIDGKAQLVNASACIGHGSCAAHCAQDAIHLVFGSEKRGIDIPQVSPTFETNVPGIFIAGELGGMGLIRKAAEQGRQAIETINERIKRYNEHSTGERAEYDLLIIGAGPAGLSASLAAKQKGLRFLALEQEDTLGGSILHYPRQKIAMTSPMQLSIVGKVGWREISKESLLEFWEDVVRKNRLPVRLGERMVEMRREPAGYLVITSRGEYHARNVLLSIGRRGTPRKLDVPGENLDKVVYRLIDPEQYRNRRVLVVGGGDSALEAALAVSDEAGAEVALSYRGNAFSRVKQKNRQRFDEAVAQGRVRALMGTEVTAIERESVTLRADGTTLVLGNDIALVCAGGVLPTPMLREIGVMIDTHYGTSVDSAAPLPSR